MQKQKGQKRTIREKKKKTMAEHNAHHLWYCGASFLNLRV